MRVGHLPPVRRVATGQDGPVQAPAGAPRTSAATRESVAPAGVWRSAGQSGAVCSTSAARAGSRPSRHARSHWQVALYSSTPSIWAAVTGPPSSQRTPLNVPPGGSGTLRPRSPAWKRADAPSKRAPGPSTGGAPASASASIAAEGGAATPAGARRSALPPAAASAVAAATAATRPRWLTAGPARSCRTSGHRPRPSGRAGRSTPPRTPGRASGRRRRRSRWSAASRSATSPGRRCPRRR